MTTTAVRPSPVALDAPAPFETPGLIDDYFNTDEPIVMHSVFVPGSGWTDEPSLPVTLSGVRALSRRRVTMFAVRAGNRIADFTVAEVERWANRPLLGGSVL